MADKQDALAEAKCSYKRAFDDSQDVLKQYPTGDYRNAAQVAEIEAHRAYQLYTLQFAQTAALIAIAEALEKKDGI